MMFLRFPLLLASLSYLTGLILASKIKSDTDSLTAVVSSAVLASIIIFYLIYSGCNIIKDRVNDKILAAVFVISFFLLAQLNLNFSSYQYKITKISSIPSGKMKYTQLIIEEVEKSEGNNTYYKAKILKYKERVRLIIKENRDDIKVGDTITGTIYIYPIRGNSKGSGYKNYMALKQIYTTAYIFPGVYNVKKCISLNEKDWINNLKFIFADIVKSKFTNKENASVIIALTSGYKGELDRETIMAFSKSGSMHLMAVSGLHVNYIYLLLSYILYFFGNTRWLRYLKTIIILACIWFYTIFTGMAASILRASIMISCLEISKQSARSNRSLNSLSFAFLLICIIDPESFYDAGFRLSFLATLSIIIIHVKFVKLWDFKSKIFKYLWNSISISISCQLGTFPLTLTYFGYLPVYFMICNLAAIPLSALIIVFTAISLVLPDGIVCDYSIILLDNLCSLLLWVVKTVESLPYATINFK